MKPRTWLFPSFRSVAFCLGLLTGPIALRATADSTDDRHPQGQYARYRMVLTEAGEDGEHPQPERRGPMPGRPDENEP